MYIAVDAFMNPIVEMVPRPAIPGTEGDKDS
jgi:hypothetical protein